MFTNRLLEIYYVYERDPSTIIIRTNKACPSSNMLRRERQKHRPHYQTYSYIIYCDAQTAEEEVAATQPLNLKATVVNNNDVKSQIDKPALNNPEIPLIIIDKPKADVMN